MIKIVEQISLNYPPEKIFSVLTSTEDAKKIFPNINSITRQSPFLPIFEGEKYEMNSTVNGKEVVQSVFVRKIVPNSEMECVATQKYVFIVSKVNLNLVGSKTLITFSYEILITNVFLKLSEPLYSRSVCKVLRENLYMLSKYIEPSVKIEDFKSQSRVWGMAPVVVIGFQYLLIVFLTVLFLQLKGRYFND